MLRILAGVDEGVLAEVPQERTRYTALGGVVLGTSVIATVSMFIALTQVTGGFSPVLLLPVLIWGLFVLNLDRWLVSSTSGSRWRRRAAILVPRLVIAFFFGVIIAEPLVLRIFDTAVVERIENDRDDAVRSLEDTLVRCNPIPGEPPAPAEGCAGFQLSLPEDPAAQIAEVSALSDEAQVLRDTIARESAELTALRELAARECTGTPGEGLTGDRGRATECLRREAAADEYAATHPIEEDTRRLVALNGRIDNLTSDVSAGTDLLLAARDTAIAAQVDELEATQGPIGLLERFQAMDDLVRANTFLLSAQWFVRIFFILIDCLPVLVKFFGGTTAYDRLVDVRIASQEARYGARVRTGEKRYLNDLAVEERDSDADRQRRYDDIDLQNRRHHAGLEAAKEQAVEERYQQLRADQDTAQRQATAREQTAARWEGAHHRADTAKQRPNGRDVAPPT